ncbi:hypothetical protein DKX38_012919 [Salix brachista]|uniref:GDSL esterase/lipase n=1 Tax=Salix brachista TaxID=2182728 RepID=A0A5N5LPX7_9ROSI|nr:hypothetical protein DKX38_012919 [Salix brachista]
MKSAENHAMPLSADSAENLSFPLSADFTLFEIQSFSDVTNACCGDGTLGGLLQCGREGYKICPNPNAFLFWDYFHPTEHAYKLISKALWGGKSSRIRPINLKTLASTP